MKKSNYIQLVLVAATISSCTNNKSDTAKKVYMRSDTTANYSHARPVGGHGGFYAFIPYAMYSAGRYSRTGYYSSSIHESSNIGTNPLKGNAVRGGFGRSGSHVSS